MNRNRYMAIIIGATAVCMIIGTLYHPLGFFRSHKNEDAGREVEIEVEERTDGSEEKILQEAEISPETEEAAETEAVSVEEDAAGTEKGPEKAEKSSAAGDGDAALKKISMKVDIADVTIRTGDEVRVDFQGDDDFKPEVTQKNGVLTVTQHVDTKWFDFFKLNNRKGIKITVTVPEGTELEELTSELDLGDVKVNGLNVEKCSVNNDLGDVKCEDCRFSEIRIYSSMGDVDVKDCGFLDLEVQQDMGDVDISTRQDLSDADLSLETDLGDLHINGKDLGRKSSQNGDGEIRVVVKNDLGDIDLDYAA